MTAPVISSGLSACSGKEDAGVASAGYIRSLKIGWSVIALVFGGILLWSFAAPFEGAVLTSGQVTVETHQLEIQHLEGGIVAEILVREAQEVAAGQLLISLDRTQVEASLEALEAQLFDRLATEARLVAERDGLRSLSIRPEFATERSDPRLAAMLKDQSVLLAARSDSLGSQAGILSLRIEQLQARTSGMEREVSSKDTQVALLQDEISRFEELAARGNVPVVRILALKRDLARLQGEKEALLSEIAATQVRMGETRNELLKLDFERRETVLSTLTEIQTDISELVERRSTLIDELRRKDIVAPRRGRIIGVRTHTIGGVVTPSQPIMYIVPEEDRLVARVRVALADIDQVAVGQHAVLRFPAFNQDETPRIEGEISRISADALADAETGAQYYEAVIGFTMPADGALKMDMRPGMPVEAAISTGHRSIISYLLKPFRDAIARTFRE